MMCIKGVIVVQRADVDPICETTFNVLFVSYLTMSPVGCSDGWMFASVYISFSDELAFFMPFASFI